MLQSYLQHTRFKIIAYSSLFEKKKESHDTLQRTGDS